MSFESSCGSRGIGKLRIVSLTILFSLIPLIAFACSEDLPPPVENIGAASCPVCLIRSEDNKVWTAQLLYPDMSFYVFDRYTCLFEYLGGQKSVLISIATIWVKDNLSNDWIHGNNAFYVKRETDPSIAEIQLEAAFEKKADAERYRTLNGGEVLHFEVVKARSAKGL